MLKKLFIFSLFLIIFSSLAIALTSPSIAFNEDLKQCGEYLPSKYNLLEGWSNTPAESDLEIQGDTIQERCESLDYEYIEDVPVKIRLSNYSGEMVLGIAAIAIISLISFFIVRKTMKLFKLIIYVVLILIILLIVLFLRGQIA